jgi:CHASE2 domain-containing sensor protein/nitrogen-specific signal transduction histidine kinase
MVKNMAAKLRLLLLLLAVVLLVLGGEYLGVYAGIDTYVYDTFLRLRGGRSVSERIVIVAIDASSLAELGKWPLPRRHYAALLDRLAQADAVGFDLLLMEPSADDGVLQAALRRQGRVVLAEHLDSTLGLARPVRQLTPHGVGHIHIEPGVDNTAREVFHTLYLGQEPIPSLSSLLHDMVSRSPLPRQAAPGRGALAGSAYQQDRQKINYYGPPGSFRRVSLAQVLAGVPDPGYFRGKIVLVGVTAPGIVDEVSTPLSQGRNRMPGVEVHANILNNLLDQSFLTEVTGWVRAAAVLCASLVLALVFLRLSERNAALTWGFSLVLGGVGASLLFFHRNLWVPPTAFWFCFSLMYLVTYLYRLDAAARRLDKEHDVMISMLGWDPDERPGQAAARGLFGFLSEGGINGKIQRQLRMTTKLLTLHKQLEIALNMEHEALENQVRLVEMLSHEYRTPLAIIRANLDILEMKDGAAGGVLSTNFGKMKRAMSRLVEVMDVSLGRERLEHLHLKMDQSEIELVPFLGSLLEETRELWAERQLELELGGCGECVVLGDRSLLKTALLNLIDNAIKYSAESEPVRVSLRTTQAQALVRVQNHGAVIPAPDLERVFEKYYRGTGSGNTRGAGLGLYLVRRIIEQFGGSVTLASSESGGTQATVGLPLAGSSKNSGHPQGPPHQIAGG